MARKPKQTDAEQNDGLSQQPNETVIQPPADETVAQPAVDPNATVVPQSSGHAPNETVIGSLDAADPNATVIGSDEPDGNATVIGQADPNQTVIGGESAGTETVDYVPDASEAGLSVNDPSRVGTMIHGTQLQEIASRGAGDSGAIGGMIGDYRVEAELGRGGMGVVYKATHSKLKREVAIKMILHGKHTGPDAIARFLTEARAVANLQHPNIVQIFDIGEHEGLPYFSLEFVPGTDLQKKIARQPQPADEAAAMVEKLARAMQYAHSENILHRDLKPANVLISDTGIPKVTDFGLAKELDESDSEGTQAGTIMGSPSYMSPEQAGGRTHEIGPPTDQYSLGAILYEMLTGRPPFLAAKPLDTVMQVVNNEPVAPRELQPNIPADLETICLKTLQKDQTQRYENCEELANDLKRYLNGEPISARPVGTPERFWRWCKRNPKVAIPSAVALIALCATAAISTAAYFKVSDQATALTEQAKVIKRERDIANAAKLVADDARQLAEQREEEAQSQADLALDGMQSVMVNVDAELARLPQLSDVRKKLLLSLLDNFDKLEVGLTKNGVAGTSIPTLMTMKMSLANSLGGQGEVDKAAEIYQELYEMGQKRLEVKGRTDSSRTNMAKILMQLANAERSSTRDFEKELKLLEESRALIQETIDQPVPQEGSPTQDDILASLGAVEQSIAVNKLTGGNIPTAAVHFEEALKANGRVLELIRSEPGFDELSNGQKDQRTYRKQMAYDGSALGLAYIILRLGQTEKAIPLYKEALAGRREIADRYPLEKNPSMVALHQAVGGYSGNFGNSLLWLGRLDEAEPLLTESVEISNATFAISKKSADAKSSLAVAHYRLGTLRDEQGRTEDAQAEFEASRTLRRELLEKSENQKARVRLMLSLARCGDVEEAATLTDELATTDKRDGELHLERARSYAQLSRHTDDEAKNQELVDKALTALERALEEGYGDPFRVSVENDLKPIRHDDRFTAVVDALKTAAAPSN